MAELEILMTNGDVIFARPTLLSYSGDSAITEVDSFKFSEMKDNGIIMERRYLNTMNENKPLAREEATLKTVILPKDDIEKIESISLGGAILWQNDGEGNLVRPDDLSSKKKTTEDDGEGIGPADLNGAVDQIFNLWE